MISHVNGTDAVLTGMKTENHIQQRTIGHDDLNDCPETVSEFFHIGDGFVGVFTSHNDMSFVIEKCHSVGLPF